MRLLTQPFVNIGNIIKEEFIMNDYELSALEGKDLYCEQCGKYISLNEYIDNEGLCNICAKEID